jgi:AraC family transcriptional regulator, regulatory protein of adaptative response / methylated-DNA-[protein]-cysteine methyltransferase
MLQGHNTEVNTTSASADWRWDAVARRDSTADGRFVYAVKSTGIFCRPSCPSRRPHRDRVEFFDSPSAAASAGFRACKRCDPIARSPARSSDDAIRRATKYLSEHVDETVPLATLARVARLSAFHLQRRFKQALGVSPREYQAACRAERFRQELRAGRDVAAATYEAGYGSPSRVYEAAPTGRGMSPATYRRGGVGTEVGFVTIRSPLGWLLVAATSKGLCAVKLGDSASALEAELRREYPRADVQARTLVRADWIRAIVDGLSGVERALALPLDVRGTAFQWRVWRALQNIAPGETRTYSDVARAIGQPSAVRAVARACATNPVLLVVPCHRVVAKDGTLGGYRWGTTRKARLLKAERKRSKIAQE